MKHQARFSYFTKVVAYKFSKKIINRKKIYLNRASPYIAFPNCQKFFRTPGTMQTRPCMELL